MHAPVTDATVVAMSRMFDDAGQRQPSHSELGSLFARCGLASLDPHPAEHVGKRKRIARVLHAAVDGKNLKAAQALTLGLLGLLRGNGGFREGDQNFVGKREIENARSAFAAEGYNLTDDGELLPLLLDNLSGIGLTGALTAYAARARRGAMDAALVTGAGKDLVEATAAHVITELLGAYPQQSNFPTLLGQGG